MNKVANIQICKKCSFKSSSVIIGYDYYSEEIFCSSKKVIGNNLIGFWINKKQDLNSCFSIPDNCPYQLEHLMETTSK